ncbi:MAG: hypothetical protein HXY45_15400 [Syntrophaceae bacterium]|nr:hypothetical protein [Syntrophaceae bacterium]
MLPRFILRLDSKLESAGRYDRIDLREGVTKKLIEKDYDRLIIHHVKLLEDVLKEAHLTYPDSNLEVLGGQVAGMDVLLGEFDPGKRLRRLVIIENKLFKGVPIWTISTFPFSTHPSGHPWGGIKQFFSFLALPILLDASPFFR